MKSAQTKAKERIQKLLRLNAIKRDGECVMRQQEHLLPQKYFECGPYRKDGQIVVQAEHLVGRANSACFADMDNIVLLCQRHHFYFKQQHGALYWHIIRLVIGEERWEKVQAWEREAKAHKATRVFLAEWEEKAVELENLLSPQKGRKAS
ncbi:hypothetical protein C4568_03610 [Candidatus Parcubacteria bacterium]|nr:MAG: hypothetical protein C4568_03610 [Candidatus Parcubacteria bacterium]